MQNPPPREQRDKTVLVERRKHWRIVWAERLYVPQYRWCWMWIQPWRYGFATIEEANERIDGYEWIYHPPVVVNETKITSARDVCRHCGK